MGTSSKKENKKKDKKDGGKKNKTLEAPIKQKVSIVQKKKFSDARIECKHWNPNS